MEINSNGAIEIPSSFSAGAFALIAQKRAFELESEAPEAPMLDQTTPWPRFWTEGDNGLKAIAIAFFLWVAFNLPNG